MTKAEAIEQLKQGIRVTHRTFYDDEWLSMRTDGKYLFEDGNVCTSKDFWEYRQEDVWDDGWEVWKEPVFDFTIEE
jgi:hypothetical protein